MKQLKIFLAVLVLILFSAGVASPAFADGVATDVSDLLTVFSPSGTIVGQVGVTEDGTVFGLNSAVFAQTDQIVTGAEGPNNFYYINDPTLANQSLIGTDLFVLDYPDGPVSDAVGVHPIGGTIFLGFISDTDTAFLLPAGLSGFPVEGDGSIDISNYLNPALSQGGYMAQFQSDVEPVPEPSTFLLLGVGVAGVGILRRKLRK